ncbi:ABC transporter permease [Saprospira grandis]|uniref:ABC transporter permease n=1 Tax=Saprospira grandis TaxID=1008 RepID=UPI0022DDDE84|nr:ABC transporter permease [Saprospira grandis]WBM74646.1 ABC transporter permease [Saprospira grandis]
MRKLWLIISREYGSRVRKRSFILTTILTPLGFLLLFSISIFASMSAVSKEKTIWVLDEANLLNQADGALSSSGSLNLVSAPKTSPDSLRKLLLQTENNPVDALLYIPKTAVQNRENLSNLLSIQLELYGREPLSGSAQSILRQRLSRRLIKERRKLLGINLKDLERAELKGSDLHFNQLNMAGEKETAASAQVYLASFLGGGMMMLIYMVILIYGNMVMRSVMEEKTSRIVEIVISSVKPFQLMLGKIIGVGAVGLTQFLIWGLSIPTLQLILSLFVALPAASSSPLPSGSGLEEDQMLMIMDNLEGFSQFNYSYLMSCFLAFFLLGYTLYASIFAAIGAAMGDDWGEGQSLTIIVTIPVVAAMLIGLQAIENPHGSLVEYASYVPFFAPVIMPARLAFDPPLWQLGLSLGILFLSAIAMIWLSGRIYRIGILLYGKQPSVKQFFYWMFKF